MIRRTSVAVLALAATVALTACGEKSEPLAGAPKVEHLSLMLDYLPNADHAGIYEAMADGEFKRAGVDLKLQTPSDPSAPLKLLAAGKVDAAISYEPELLLARDKGLDLISIGALIQKPLTSIIALGSQHMRSAADLEGHTVGTAGIPYQSAYLKTIVTRAGGDPSRVKEVNVGFNLVPAMLTKRVYATLGAFWNVEGIQLKREHKSPKIIPVDQAGVPTYDELVIVVRRGEARARGELLRRFLQALSRGQTAVAKDPDRGAAALVKANPDLNLGLQKAEVRATVPAFLPANKTQPFGFQDTAEWAAYGAWMFDNKLIKRLPNPALELTNEYLPGQGV